MRPIIFLSAMDKLLGRLGFLILERRLVKEKRKSKFKSLKLCLKIDFCGTLLMVKRLDKYLDITPFITLPFRDFRW